MLLGFTPARRADDADTDTIEHTIAEVAAKVRVPSALAFAVHQYSTTKAAHQGAIEELHTLARDARDTPIGSLLHLRLYALEASVRRLERDAAITRDAAQDARPPYVAAVAAALRPIGQRASARAEAALADMEQALSELAQIDSELVRAGATPRRPLVIPREDIIATVRRHVG